MGAVNKINVKGVSYDILGLPVGTIFSSALPQVNSGVHLLDGSYIATNGVYKDFCDLIIEFSTDYDILCDEEDYAEDLAATGNCGKFVLNTTERTLRLPTITTFIQGLSDITHLGRIVEAGLPNITGRIDVGNHSFNAGVSEGAEDSVLYSTGAKQGATVAGNSGSGWRADVQFDASRSNEIYGNSNTVQPASVKYPYYIVLATIKKTNIEVNIDNVAADIALLQTKVGKLETNYGFHKFDRVSVSSSSSPYAEITITTKGRPVYCQITGDVNPTSNGGWLTIHLTRIDNGDSVTLARQIVQSPSNSCNIPFSVCFLDIVPAGTYTYKAQFVIGSGTIDLAESDAYQSPNFVVYEI